MTIQRRAKRGPRSAPVGPNTTEYCVECQAVRPNGFWIHDRVSMGERGIFVCDECLAKAKKKGSTSRLLIEVYGTKVS